ncbi:MAG TPA: DUF1540 domain-containing protein [Symbiobacteriaceae bacterium]|nr:DUF1540 domain-containing protein [Symbiobacteriaceae bacterium]
MANQQIYCTVNSCYYYGNGDRCRAEKIEVQNNQATLGNTRMEIGSIGGSDAGRSNQTLCNTFIPKDKGPKPGINRMD